MNLDVAIRLIDHTSRPARDAARALERFGAAAGGIANRTTVTTRAVRSLAGALQAVKAADGAAGSATASAGRLRGTLAAIGPASRTAAGGLDRFGRAADRITRASTKAAASTRELHTALGASPPSGGFVAGAEAQLRGVVALQRTAIANMRTLAAGGAGGGGRGGRRGMAGASGHGGGGAGFGSFSIAYEAPGLTNFARKAIADTEDAENALTQVRMTGLAPRDVDRIKALAQRVAADNPLTTYAENIRGIIEARTALSGDLDDALKLFPKASMYAAIYAHSGGVSGDQVKAAKDSIYAALRAGELRNVANDPARMDSLLSGIMGANIASDGRITPKMFASNIQYARSAGLSLSDRFTNMTLPFLMGELQNGGKGAHGGQAGNALMSAYATIVQGRIAKASIPEWEAAGQLDKRDLHDGKVRPGSIKGTAKFMEDPRAFVADLMANFTQRGITSQTAILEHLSAMFGNRTAAGLMDLMALQDSRMSGFAEMTKMAGAGDPGAANAKFAMIQNELSTATAGLSHSFGLLRTTAVAPFIPAVTEATRRLTDMTTATQGFIARVLGAAANDPNDPNKHGLSWGAMATIGGAGLFGASHLVTRMPGVATLLGQAAVASQAGPAAGFLSRATVSASVEALSARLSTGVGAGLTRALGKGVLGGLIYEAGTFAIDRLIAALPKPTVSDQQKARGDANNRQLTEAWIWQKPGLIRDDLTHRRPSDFMPGGRRYGEPVPADLQRYVGAGTGTPIAGARALGGPVLRGQSYLVGERGPEIFTPGQAGAISTHAATRLALARNEGGDPGEISTSREIRYLSFALVSAVDGVTRAIDRLRGAPATGLDGTAGGSAASGGAVGAGGGRRGFMARAGHFGAGAGGSEVVPGGVRVGPVTARGGAGRGMTAAKIAAAQESFNFWRSKGATHAQAAAMVANEETESSFNPRAIGDKGTAHGIMQWHRDRRQNILRGTGINIDTATHLQQLEASFWEMTKGNERDGGRRFFAARNEREAVDALVNHFERPADRAGNVRGRTAGALRWAGRFGEGAPLPAAVADTGAKVPASVEQAAKAKGERDRRADAAARERPASAGRGATMHVGSVHVHVAAHPHHDERKIASAVHEQFTQAVHRQLNDGAFA